MRNLIATLIGGALSLASGAAEARSVHFLGAHPISPQLGKGMCHIEGPHIHSYGPHKPLLYIKAGGSWSFVGDPTMFVVGKEEHPQYAYYGHHPLFWHEDDIGQHYCYISGPHHHWYEPPDELQFELKGGVYWWVGGHPAWYKRRRHARIDRYYTTEARLVRPVVTVTPPSGFVGLHVGPRGARTIAEVASPSVHINLPVPTVDIHIGGGRPSRRTHVIHHYHARRGPPGWAKAHGHGGREKIKIKAKGPKRGKKR